ncbi:MAG: aminotransferase class I/II-fold pyridoxal phosphate-dependent enzyme, partial [Tissierellaceae bacterium]
ENRRNYMYDTINSIKGLSCRKPEGAFYIMVNFSQVIGKTIKGRIINSSLDFSSLLLEEANVAVIPGIGFGVDAYIRLSYATSLENIREGLDRIRNVLEN